MNQILFRYLALIIFLHISIAQNVYSQCNHPDDYTALRALYLSTDGDNWTDKTGWPTRAQFLANPTPPAGTDMSGWYGIRCGSGIKRINCIDMDGFINCDSSQPFSNGNNLTGTLPKELDNLIELNSLSFAYNKLTGDIPNLKLINLWRLWLNNNQFTSNIPNFELPKLSELYLYNNKIIGTIPNFNFLPNLQTLRLANNQLSGEIPNFNLTKLNQIDLENNKLSGEIPNFNLPSLLTLNLRQNQITGSIPNFKLPKLNLIVLTNNNLSGSIPNFDLPNLYLLDLGSNNLKSCIPSSFYRFCDSITVEYYFFGIQKVKPYIQLNNNPLLPWQGDFAQFCSTDGSQQAQIGAPCNNGNSADGENDVIQDDCSCGLLPPCNHPDYAALIELYDSTNGAQWTNNTGWKEGKEGKSCDPCNYNGQPWFGLQCSNARVVCIDLDGIPDCIDQAKDQGNNLRGILTESLNNLTELKILHLSHNSLSGLIPNLQINKLEGIHISGTNLSGTIPNFNLPRLKYLYLPVNKLTGKLPNMQVPELEYLWLNDNFLDGQIQNFDLKKLKSLNLSRNMFEGEIPDFNLPYLFSLQLSNNKLTGKIPLLDSTNLRNLEIDINKLSGVIPEFTLKNLHTIYFNYNNLSGCIPSNYKVYCDSILVDDLVINGKKIKVKPRIQINNNPLLPWQGDFAQFCATDGSQQAQIGAPCNNNNPADGENDVIKADCSCGRLDCPDVKLSLNDIVVQLCDTGEKIPLTFTILDTLPSGAIDITWSSPNANTRAAIDTVSNPPLFDTQIAGAGNHLIILTLKQGNCTWTNSMLITSIATPSSDFTVGPGGCVLDPVTVSYTGGTTGAVYTWNFGPDVIGTYSGPGPHSVRWSNPGQKTITLTVFKDGCVSTVTTRTISLSPVLDAPTITCLETKVDGVTFSWGAVQNTNGYNVNVQIVGGAILFQGVVTNTSYDVNNLVEGQDVRITVTAISNNGCPNSSASLICKAKSCPDARLSIPERQITACLTPDIAPIPLTFSIANNIPNETPTISWYSASPKTNTAIKNNTNPPVFVPLEAGEGTHFIELKYEQKGCIWTDSMLIKLNLPAAVLLKNDTVYVKSNVPVVLNVTDNDELPSEPFTIKVKEISTETITVTNFDDQGNITLQVNDEINAEERITYEVCDDCNLCYEGILVIINEDFKNFIPVTLFTPDASSNKTLQFTKLPVKDSKLWIYNRWGQQIYYKEGYENDWNAEGYPGGVYYYYLEIYGVKIKKALTVVK